MPGSWSPHTDTPQVRGEPNNSSKMGDLGRIEAWSVSEIELYLTYMLCGYALPDSTSLTR
jgi:hypothetical protein